MLVGILCSLSKHSFIAGKKGGALLSAIHSNTKVGDPYVRDLMKDILNTVSQESLCFHLGIS